MQHNAHVEVIPQIHNQLSILAGRQPAVAVHVPLVEQVHEQDAEQHQHVHQRHGRRQYLAREDDLHHLTHPFGDVEVRPAVLVLDLVTGLESVLELLGNIGYECDDDIDHH